MKLLHFITGLAVVALAACSNDSLVDPSAVDNRDTQPIGFAVKSANQGRSTALESVHHDFGVWGYKGNDFTANGVVTKTSGSTPIEYKENTVMTQYLVAWTGDGGYTAPSDPSYTQTSKWFYEGFGSSDTDPGCAKSANANQYLKFWDLSWTNVYFFAYAPYAYGSDGYEYVKFNEGTSKNYTLEYQHHVWASPDAVADWMYGGKIAASATYQQTTVPIEFNRIMAHVRVAVYEEIPGYKVQMEPIEFASDKADCGLSATESDSTYYKKCKSIVMMPATLSSGSDPAITANTDGFTIGAIPSVKFEKGTSDMEGTVTLTDYKDKNVYGFFSLPLYNATAGTAENISETKVSPSYSTSVYKMIPNDGSGAKKTGFQVVMNFKLIAEDTGEVIHVKGARVFVSADYTAWEANHVYNYIFRITKNTSGTTGTPDPDPEPDDPDGPALYPIIFDNLIVTDYASDTKYYYDVNGATDSGTPTETTTTP